MTNIYEKSLELMDVHFDSISDEDFMQNYLSVEDSKGPLVKDFLTNLFLFDCGYDIEIDLLGSPQKAESLNTIDLSSFADDLVGFNSFQSDYYTISVVTVHSDSYGSLHAKNDGYDQLIAA